MNEIYLDIIVQELQGNREVFLKNCINNYSEYVDAAKILFPDYYRSLNRFEAYGPLIQESIYAKDRDDISTEIEILEKLVSFDIDVPYVYERLAIIYSKEKKIKEAQAICQRWFDSPYWKIPNMATTSLRLYKRLEKLNFRLSK